MTTISKRQKEDNNDYNSDNDQLSRYLFFRRDSMKGYWTGYSYAGLMPDGAWMYFSSDNEYKEFYDEASLKGVLHVYEI